MRKTYKGILISAIEVKYGWVYGTSISDELEGVFYTAEQAISSAIRQIDSMKEGCK